MSLAASIIVLNDDKWIGQCLESLRFCDGVFIVDGGSTDRTVDIIKEKKNQGMPIKLDYVPWEQNFSVQRNHALDMIPADFDWFMRVDSDERAGNMIRENMKELIGSITAKDNITSIRIRQCNLVKNSDDFEAPSETYYAAALKDGPAGGWETWPRVFRRNLSKVRWVGQVHECIWVDDKPLNCNSNFNAAIIHYGWLDTEKMKRKEEQYMRIPGSGFSEPGSLTGREYVIRRVPPNTL